MTDTWRFLDTGHCAAAYNMALDEAIAIAVKRESAPPTLRFYGWQMPSVSIGYFQKIKDVDVGYCAKRNIPLVRRLTGGRAILHGDEITYSFSSKTTSGRFSNGLLDSYRKISTAFGLALSKMGIDPELKLMRASRGLPPSGCRSKSPSCFQSVSYGEIAINGRKVIGSAQKRWTDALLQQGSIPLTIDKDTAIRIFGLHSVDNAGLAAIVPLLSITRINDLIRTSFEETFDVKFTFSAPSEQECSLAHELETRKYLSYEWNFKR
jgi:lipoate-protein ligase A